MICKHPNLMGETVGVESLLDYAVCIELFFQCSHSLFQCWLRHLLANATGCCGQLSNASSFANHILSLACKIHAPNPSPDMSVPRYNSSFLF